MISDAIEKEIYFEIWQTSASYQICQIALQKQSWIFRSNLTDWFEKFTFGP